GGLRLRDADEAVHDAPYGAEQANERRGRADGGEHAGSLVHLAASRNLQAGELDGDALLDACLVIEVGGELKLLSGGLEKARQDAAPSLNAGIGCGQSALGR